MAATLSKAAVFLFGVLLSAATAAAHLPTDRIKLPPGFRIEVWARVDSARAMALGAANTLFVGSRQGESVWGRPVDVLVLPDGSMLISDDHAGAIYRITHRFY